ncbi:MAG: DUF4129 domain-containing protein [Acidobacteriaceae bacterium]
MLRNSKEGLIESASIASGAKAPSRFCCLYRGLKPAATPFAAVVLLGCSTMAAQTAPVKSAAGVKHESVQEFQAHLAIVQALVRGCGGAASACVRDKVGADVRVDAKPGFQVRWQWLREALDQARSSNVERRAQLMQESSARLDEMVRESAQPEGETAQFAQARKSADQILAGADFAAVERESWLDRQVAKFWLWWGRFWERMGSLGGAAPWLGRLLEVLLFGGAAAALALFVYRNLQRQRLAVALNAQAGGLEWQRESTDWAAQAEGSAGNGDWRDAVHCLYWATIVMLEGRRAWRHNPARTPREYVRLLKPGSAQQSALRGLTQIFERLWYGLREAGATDYEKARSHYESLRDNSAAGAA